MTTATSEGYAKFLDLLRWCDDSWTNAIQASQEWWRQKLGVSVRTVKRYWAQAKLDGILGTLKRYRRTSIQTLKGGRHDQQLKLDSPTQYNQQVADTCPLSVPTVSNSNPDRELRIESSVVVRAFEKVRGTFFAKKLSEPPKELRDPATGLRQLPSIQPKQRDPWELRLERAERERAALAKLPHEVRVKLGLAEAAKELGI